MKIFNLLIVSCLLFLVGVSVSLISPFYPTEALKKGVSVTLTGLVIGSVFVTVIIATPVFGKYIQKLGTRRFLIIGSFLVGSGNIAFGFLNLVDDTIAFFSLSILLRFVIAVGDSAVAPAALTLAGKLVDEKHKGKALAGADASFAAGTMFGPAIGGYLYDLGGFSLPFFVTGIAMALLSLLSVLCFKDNDDDQNNNEVNISWMDILKSPGVPVGVFSIVVGGVAKRWYAASLGPFLAEYYDLTSSQIGLVFMPFGFAYSFMSPIVGLFTDRGLDCLLAIIIGIFLIAISLFFMGPIPLLLPLIGKHLWLTVSTIGLQGVGSAFAYIGSLVFMTRQVVVSGLPKSDQVNAMVSSLWLTSECLGCFIGSTLGSCAFDTLGFQMGTMILAFPMCAALLLLVICMIWFRLNKADGSEGSGSEADEEQLISDSEEVDNFTDIIHEIN